MAANFWLSTHYNKWILDKQQVARCNSRHGLSPTDLAMVRILFANVAQSLGVRLNLRQQVVATAIVYFQRFYSNVALRFCDPLLNITTCVYLAAKVEESGLVSVNAVIANITSVIAKDYTWAFKRSFPYIVSDVVECEFYLLEELGCYLVVYHPYRPLTQFVKDICEKNPALFPKEEHLLSLAWYIVNDSYRTECCLMYAPHLIALTAIYLACVMKDKELKQAVIEWFAEISVNPDEVLEIAICLFASYEHWDTYSNNKALIMDDIFKRIAKSDMGSFSESSTPSAL